MSPKEKVSTATLNEAGDLSAPEGSREWAIAVRDQLVKALSERGSNTAGIGTYLRLLDEHKGYRQLTDASGKPFASLRGFSNYRRPWGLNIPADTLKRMAAVDLNDVEPVGKQGKRKNGNENPDQDFSSDSRAGIIARLKKDKKFDLADQVIGGLMTATDAGRLAGYIKPRATIRLDNAKSAAKTIRDAGAPVEFIRDLISELEKLLEAKPPM